MIRIEGIHIVAARLAAELKSTKTVETSTPFRQQRMLQASLPVLNNRPVPSGKKPRPLVAQLRG